MASIALGALGSALGPVGGALGSLFGAYLDRAVLNPLLSPKPTVEGPRVADFRLQQHEEGANANWALGPQNRLGNVFIWASDIREVRNEEEVGGKGGGQKVSRYSYFVDLAISYAIQRGAVCNRILAEGSVLYDRFPNKSAAGNTIAAAVVGTTDVRLRLTAPDGGPDLSVFVAGKDATVSGFVASGNNGGFEVEQAGTEPGGTFVVLKNSFGAGEAAGAAVSIVQTLPQWDEGRVAAVETHDGTQTTPSATIEANRGIGNVPAYAGSAYVVLKNLLLEPYGNRVPQLSFVVAGPAGATIADAVAETCKRSGMTASQFDVAGVSGALTGYALNGPVSGTAALQPLLVRGDLLTQEADAKLRFFQRDRATVVWIPREKLAAAAGLDAERPSPWRIAKKDGFALAPRIVLRYIDSQSGNQTGGEPHVRNGEEAANIQTVYLPVAMTAAEARAVEKRLAYAAKLGEDLHRLQLGPEYLGLGENDVIATWWTPQEIVWLQVLRVDEDPDHNVRVEAQLWHRALSTQTASADAPFGYAIPFHLGSGLDYVVLDAPVPAGGNTVDEPIRVPAMVAVPDDDDPFGGAALMGSVDDATFGTLASVSEEGTFGRARTVLGGTGIATGVWDRVSSVDVEVWHGTLESRDEADVLDGANRAMVGQELVGFATATLIGARRYRLTNLLRGLRDTDDHLTTHAADERFALLTGPGVRILELPLTALNGTRYLKCVPVGRDPADYDATPFVVSGRNLRPLKPTALVGYRDASGNLELFWQRRTRAAVPDLPAAPVPWGEEQVKFEVELWHGGTLRRAATVYGTSLAYTAAEHDADSVALFAAVEVRVYQIGGAYGRGRALIGSV